MNKKQFIILLVLVVVLGLWGMSRWRGQTSSYSGGGNAVGQKLLGDFDVNAVVQLVVKQGANELLLAKQDDVWRVAQRDNYPADFAGISSLLVKLKNLKVVQTEQVGASQLPRLELAPGGKTEPTSVEFRDASGKAIKTLTLGKKHMQGSGQDSAMDEMGGGGGYPDGRYVQVSGAVGAVSVISDPLTDVEPVAGRWLNKSFFKIEKPKSISVTFAEATNSWTLTRETEGGQWKLAEAKAEEKLDAGKSAGVTAPFGSPTLNDVAVGLTPEQSGLDKPTVIKVATFDGFEYTVNIGAKKNENYLLTVAVVGNFPKERVAVPDEKPEDKAKADKEFTDNLKRLKEKLATETMFGKWTYQVATWTVDPLLKKRVELVEEKSAETKATGTDSGGSPQTGASPPGA
jgi:hypothetical protein